MSKILHVLVVSSLLAPVAARAQGTLSAPPPGEDWVAVAVAKEAVVLATPALRRYGMPLLVKGGAFRFRSVPLDPKATVESAALSPDGTQLLVRHVGTGASVEDLTTQVFQAGVPSSDTPGFVPGQVIGILVHAGLTAAANTHLRDRFQNGGTLGAATEWQVYQPAPPDVARYTPVIRLLREERVLPSRFEVWSDILREIPSAQALGMRSAKLSAREELLRAYSLLPRTCSIYWKRTPYAGSWLLQYWLYYPFDYGLNGHLHDSEHIFVEVDRLGGAVRRVAGAGHGIWAANSVYHTFVNDALPVKLPVHGLVELGKHATAPDINNDGVFTPGVDANLYWDASKVWGIRDTTGTTDSSLRQFDGTMAVPRSTPESRQTLIPRDWRHHPGDPDRSEGRACELLEIRETAGATASCKDVLSAECARFHVEDNSDYSNPHSILKAAAFPRQYVRAGSTFVGGRSVSDEDSPPGRPFVGAGVELQSLRLRIPGRVYFQSSLGRRLLAPGRFAVAYERLDTNLFGYYFGVTSERRSQPNMDDRYSSLLSGGMLLELALPQRWLDGFGSGLNFHARAGVNSDGKTGIGFESHVGIGVTYGSLFRKFGIRSSDPNPY